MASAQIFERIVIVFLEFHRDAASAIVCPAPLSESKQTTALVRLVRQFEVVDDLANIPIHVLDHPRVDLQCRPLFGLGIAAFSIAIGPTMRMLVEISDYVVIPNKSHHSKTSEVRSICC